MNKGGAITFVILWLLVLPIALLAVGFGGSKVWSVEATIEELADGESWGIILRILFLLYFIAPVYVALKLFRSRRR